MALPPWKVLDPIRGKPFRRLQREWNRRAYRYPLRNLLIIGQQKSGSTWVERMVCEVQGYMRWIPNYIKYEQADLQDAWHERVPPGYSVTKVHTSPSEENRRIIHATGRPYVVLLRDLRDIAASWVFYVGNTPAHPCHADCKDLDVGGRLDYFFAERLPAYTWWAQEWQKSIHPELGLIVRYEQLLADTLEEMRKVFAHFEVGLSNDAIGDIVARHEFKRATGGRAAGEEDRSKFNRKGVSGDWRNHFTDAHKAEFKRIAGDTLIELGYESDLDW